jgi:rubrerythrin
MKCSFNIRQVSHKVSAILSATTLGILTLGGCTQQPPSALIQPTQSSQQTQPIANKPDSATLNNLQEAYNGESNAHVRYLAFAKKADEEGYKQVGRLFRAAARAEEIHRDNHAAVIKQMGAIPENKIETPTVKSTKENLKAAIKGESYERDTMYPEFIKQAEKVGDKAAVRTLKFAVEAEREHAKLYTLAKDNLESWKEAKNVLYVCPECGYTTLKLDFANCPDCGTSKEKFETIV